MKRTAAFAFSDFGPGFVIPSTVTHAGTSLKRQMSLSPEICLVILLC